MSRVLIFVLALVTGSAAQASSREEMYQRMVVAFAHAQCAIIMQKQHQTTVSKPTEGDYIANNGLLHRCLYVHESSICSTIGKPCPSYEAWSKAHPELSPQLPRTVFIAALERQRQKVSALSAALP